MPTVIRSLAAMAAVATFAAPLSAQRPAPHPLQAPPNAPTVPAVPAPPMPNVPGAAANSAAAAAANFGEAMGKWGESLGQAMGRMGDSLGKLGQALGEAEADEATNRTDANRARVDSLKRALNDVERTMRESHLHSRDWRAFARQTREQVRSAMAQGNTAAAVIERVRLDPEAIPMPPADSFATGTLTIPAGTQRAGTVAVANGDLQVFGTVTGNAIAVNGNVEIHPGGSVAGDAFAAGGQVRVDSGGMVNGEIRWLTGDFGPAPVGTHTHLAATTPAATRWHHVRMALMAFALLLMLSIGVLIFAEEQLDHVTATLADRFGLSAWYGILGTLALGPVLGLMTLALTITLVGILVVPFAVVAYVAIAIGAAILGFIAIAEAAGTAVLPTRSQSSLTHRGAQLRAIVTGVSIFGGLWLLAEMIGTGSGVGIAVHLVAAALTLVAVIVGFGAVILWRFDVRRANRAAAASKTPLDDAVWQTPTPVAGVAAARRTEAAGTSSGRPS